MRQVHLARVTIRVPKDGLITYKIKVAVQDHAQAHKIVEKFLADRGYTPDFNANYEIENIPNHDNQPIYTL